MRIDFEAMIDFRIAVATRKLRKYVDFMTAEKDEWDGIKPLYSEYFDEYFFSKDQLHDFMYYEQIANPDRLMLYICDPQYLSEVTTDQWIDTLPDEGELPCDVHDALDDLNSVIRKQGPVSWYPTCRAVRIAIPGAQQ